MVTIKAPGVEINCLLTLKELVNLLSSLSLNNPMIIIKAPGIEIKSIFTK